MNPDARTEYADIIDREHYVDPNHPQMPRLNRAAQFSPFAALTGYEDMIVEAARQTDEWAEPDDSAKEEIGRKLNAVLQSELQPEVTVTYFVPDDKKAGGRYVTVSGNVRKLDGVKRVMVFADGTRIPIEDIGYIDGSLFQRLGF